MIFFPISALINAITSSIVCIIALVRNPKSELNRSFSYFAFSVAFWSYFYFLWQISSSAELALLWCRVLMAGAIFIPSTFFHFSLTLIGQRAKYLKSIIFWYLVSILFLISDFTPLFVKDIKPRLFFPQWPSAGPTYAPFLAVFIGLTIYAHVLMYKAYRKLTGVKRNQIKYVFLGTAIGFVGGSTNYPLWYDIPIPPIGNILVAVYVFLVAYSIVKYRLMDINIAFTRAGIFLVVYTIVLGIPFWVGYVTKSWLLPTTFAVILASSGPFIYQSLRRRAEDIILKEQRRYQQIIKDLSKRMVNIRDLDDLLKTITSTIADAVRVKCAAIFLKNEEYKSYQIKCCYPQEEKSHFQELIPYDNSLIEVLNRQSRPLLSEEAGSQDKINLDSGLIIPCFGRDGLLGLLVLGAKPNHKMYTPDDLLAFENLSYNASLAIENCTYWKEIEDRQRKARLQEMDTFSYSLAHEIDNPMTFVYNLTKFLKNHFLKYVTESEERKEVEEACNHVIEGSERVMGMVKAIRQFGQKGSGELESLNLQEVIDGFCRLYSPELKANFVVFTKDIPQEPIFVKGVAAEIQQILMIFAKNAVHAMKFSQEKKLSLCVTKVNHNTVRIALTDTGYGIKQGNLQTIFAPFFTSKASTEGTGMGLHNAKGFALRHNGKVWAESEGENKGSTFILELPTIDAPTGEQEKKERKKWAF